MVDSGRRSAGRRRAEARGRGLIGLLCWLGLLGFVAFAGLARGADEARSESTISAQPYRSGPLAARETSSMPELPDGAEELFGLSVLGVLLYGLRAAGLSRESERP